MSYRLSSIALAFCLLATGARAGWEYTATTTSATEPSTGAAAGTHTLQAQVDGDNARIEYSGIGPMMPAGSYMLMQGGGQKMYMVKPQDKSYVDMSSMMGMASGAMGMMNMQIKDAKSEKLLEEKGEKLLGYNTTHYRYRTSYTMEMNFMGMAQSSTVVKENDTWSAPALQSVSFSLKGFQQNMKTGNAQLDQLIALEKESIHGFPLKSISAQTTTDSRGQVRTIKTSMTVTELKKATIPADRLALPEGYQETQMPTMPQPGMRPQSRRPVPGTQGGAAMPDMKAMLEQLKKSMPAPPAGQ